MLNSQRLSLVVSNLSAFFPLIAQLRVYDRQQLGSDVLAACVVTMMLIPQSLAYAMLAGVPPEVGLYASILPLLAYALLGSCKTLAVGPVAIASLMTASALGQVTLSGDIAYLDGAMILALLSGAFLLLLGLLRLGFLVNFLSHSVVAGFITASGLVIAVSQLKHLFGIHVSEHHFFAVIYALIERSQQFNIYTFAIGITSLIFLFWARRHIEQLFCRLGLSAQLSAPLYRMAPVVGVVVATLLVVTLKLDQQGVAIVGEVPIGVPTLRLPQFSWLAVEALWLPAVLIAIIGYVESVSVGKTLSAKRRELIDGNQELLGLGAANLASGFSGALPVTGGFARSVVNFDAGAATQMAGVFTAIGVSVVALTLTPLLYFLPKAMLAATIVVAVLSLLDWSIFKRAWQFSKGDFFAVMITVLLTLVYGVEIGVAAGIVTSILLHLYHTSEPHIAEVGLVQGSEHFRNILHYHVETQAAIVSLRIDESLLFSNAVYLEEHINDLVFRSDDVVHIVLQCHAINTIDLSALEMLEQLNVRLTEQGITLHLAEIKRPVRNLLEKSGFFQHFSGKVFLSQYEAYRSLCR